MRNLPNIEPSSFHLNSYVGYGHGAVWSITKSGREWLAIPRQADAPDNIKHLRLRYPSLNMLSVALDSLNH